MTAYAWTPSIMTKSFAPCLPTAYRQKTVLNPCVPSPCTNVGLRMYTTVLTHSSGTERIKIVYCLPVLIGIMLSFFAADNPALGAVLGFFVNSVINSLILLAVSVIVYIVCYFVSAKNFNFKLLIPSSQGR